MKIAITGASGFLGSNLAILLSNKNFDVICLKRATSKIEHLREFGFNWKSTALENIGHLIHVFQDVDFVFHCAAHVAISNHFQKKTSQINVKGTENVIKACQVAKVKRLVYCSSVDAFGLPESDYETANESTVWNWDKLKVETVYARSKKDSQNLVLNAAEQNLDCVVVNPAYMLGPYDARPSSGSLLLEFLRRKIFFIPPGKNNFVDVRDVAQGMLSALEMGVRGGTYILGNQNLSYAEILQETARIARKKPPRFKLKKVLTKPVGLLGDFAEVLLRKENFFNSATMKMAFLNHTYSSEKAIKQLTYHPQIPIEVTLADTIEWFRRNGML